MLTTERRFVISPADMERVMTLGNWPDLARARAVKSLAGRIPTAGGTAAGFDAGVACCLKLIPRDREQLAATLHANYTREAVEQVQREAMAPDADSATTWWLAACSVCVESTTVDEEAFAAQVRCFESLADDRFARLEAAMAQYAEMCRGFEIIDGIPHATRDGGMQGAYIAGHPLAVHWAERWGVYFIGTYLPSLGLEDFTFGNAVDGEGRPMSGLLSPNFAKCTKEELPAVLAVARGHLGV